ncbi:MAG: response regulator [Marinoscillum sp.]
MEGSKSKILIIEDDAALCELLDTYLGPSYEVKATINSLLAWEWLSEGNYPDLILTDFKMPYVNGSELIENLRTSGLYQEIPIIILTGSKDPSLVDHCRTWKIDTIITKPFNPADLLSTIETTLKQTKHA